MCASVIRAEYNIEITIQHQNVQLLQAIITIYNHLKTTHPKVCIANDLSKFSFINRSLISFTSYRLYICVSFSIFNFYATQNV